MTDKAVASAISKYGAAAKAKLSNVAVTGQPEDQLRNPLENLFHDLAAVGAPLAAIQLVGESSLSDLKTRPDFAVSANKALVGFIEVKAPGKGADPRKFKDAHDAEQWEKLKSLPNLIYTDGNSFSLWRDGKLEGSIVKLDGDIESSGNKLAAPPTLMALITSFLNWQPIPPKNAVKLAEVAARLCRLLRDEVVEQLALGHEALTGLQADWRKLLFPEADDTQFADGYAQAVTFGLLVARARGIALSKGIEGAAQELRKSNSLIATALRLLTDDATNQKALQTSLGTLTRVLDAVDWPAIAKDDPDAWLYFYENFLEVYDNALRKRTGSYYTPPEVVSAMVNLVDEALRGPLFERPLGFAAPDVTVADPAVGTGTFVLGVLRRIADTVKSDKGAGAVSAAIEKAANRVIGFEIQFGPFAVAQLRIMAEMHTLMATTKNPLPEIPEARLYITDTLGNPFVEEQWLPQMMQPIAQSRQKANAIKRDQPITVVIGNPPYKEKAEGRGGWIESGTQGLTGVKSHQAPLDRWKPPASWGVGTHTKHLRNLYVYFWRWATWKVFGAGFSDSTGLSDKDLDGIVCFITVAGFLNGPGFEKMRDDLRRTCSAIWAIDCSPEGHQPAVSSRIFQAVQQPVCIVLAARKLAKSGDVPARVRFLSLTKADRKKKFVELNSLSLKKSAWEDCSSGWRDPFLPEATGAWAQFPSLDELFVYNGSGVMPGRTWIIAPDKESLEQRWQVLIKEKDKAKKDVLFHPHEGGDKTVEKMAKAGLPGHEYRAQSVGSDKGEVIEPVRYAFRSFDRQWIIPDTRLINRPNPTLWNWYSGKQVFLTALEAHSPTSGPPVTFADLIPDLHHYKGSFGGRAFPLWRDSAATEGNFNQDVLHLLGDTYHGGITAEDMLAYIAAVMAHPAFTKRFAGDLVQPGLRLPITAERKLLDEAVAIGREVIWLHTYGERFVDAKAGRPKGPPRIAKDTPTMPAGGGIPGAPEPLPDAMAYDAAKKRLIVGLGHIDNVTAEMWNYEVSGKEVLKHWFSYRKRDRSRPIIGDRRPPSPLDQIQPDHWLPEYTDDLIDLLNVLGRLIALEPAQANLLERICAGPLIDRKIISALTTDHEKPAKTKKPKAKAGG